MFGAFEAFIGFFAGDAASGALKALVDESGVVALVALQAQRSSAREEILVANMAVFGHLVAVDALEGQ